MTPAGEGREIPREPGAVEVVAQRVGLDSVRVRRFACSSSSFRTPHSTFPVHRYVYFPSTSHTRPHLSPAHGGDLGFSPSHHPGCPCPGGLAGTSGICLRPHTLLSNDSAHLIFLYA